VRVRETKFALTTLCTRKYAGEKADRRNLGANLFQTVRSLSSGKLASRSLSRRFSGSQISGEKSGLLEAIRPQALQSRGRHSESGKALDQ
jgi:hypothetical protein